MERIFFTPEGEAPVAFYVLEQTKIGGVTYILVTDQEEGDGDALILKDTAEPNDEESIFEIVDNETELAAVASVFENILDDIELSSEGS